MSRGQPIQIRSGFSGLLYPSGELAERAWKSRNDDWHIKQNYLCGPQLGYNLALNEETVEARSAMWAKWNSEGRDIPVAIPLTDAETRPLRSGGVNLAGGWTTPDCT